MLPDQKTIIKIDIGETETEICNELVTLYRNSALLNLDIDEIYSDDSRRGANLMLQKKKDPDFDNKKSLYAKVEQTIKKFCKEECYEPINIEAILLTGGALELGSQSGKSLGTMLSHDLDKLTKKDFDFCHVIKSEQPHVGSIMNGAKVMFAMPQFDEYMTITKKEYEFDNTSIVRKLF